MAHDMSKPYLLDSELVRSAVVSSAVTAGHAQLLKALRSIPGFENTKLATKRGDRWYSKRKVLNEKRELVSDDFKAWMAGQLEMDHGNAPATWARMKSLGYFLTQRGIEALYLVNDNCGRQSEFVQIEVNVETEYVDRPLYFHHWNSPRDLRDLVDDNGGSQFTGEDRTVFEPPTYKLEQILDVAAYMQLAQAEHAQQRQAIARRAYKLTEGGGESKVISHAELDPGFEKFPWWNGQRMFDDWTISSAGRSGVRLCDHWVLDASDYTDPRGDRTMSFVPLWTLTKPVAAIEKAPNIHTLFGKLQSLDKRVKVPFGWFFFMLHGNRVKDDAGRRVLDAAERGELVLPEHDYQVLKRWAERPYGF